MGEEEGVAEHVKSEHLAGYSKLHSLRLSRGEGEEDMAEPGGEDSDENKQLSLHSFMARQMMLSRRKVLKRLRWLLFPARVKAWLKFMEMRCGVGFGAADMENRRWEEICSSSMERGGDENLSLHTPTWLHCV